MPFNGPILSAFSSSVAKGRPNSASAMFTFIAVEAVPQRSTISF
jgi:hypothetical protein